MLKRKRRGVSLIEVMVVVSIIGILTVISVPIYKSYTTKSKFAEVFATINEYKGEMQAAYAISDQFPSSFSNLSENVYTSIDTSTLKQIYYETAMDKQAGYLLLYTQDLGVPGFVLANSGGTGGTAGRIALSEIVVNTGETTVYCGQWDGSAADVPLNYLPASCQNTNIKALTIPGS